MRATTLLPRPVCQPYLVALVASDPFTDVDRTNIYDIYGSFIAPGLVVRDATPCANPRRDVEVERLTDTDALCISRTLTSSPASPNVLFERAFAQPATTRALNSVVRLGAKHG